MKEKNTKNRDTVTLSHWALLFTLAGSEARNGWVGQAQVQRVVEPAAEVGGRHAGVLKALILAQPISGTTAVGDKGAGVGNTITGQGCRCGDTTTVGDKATGQCRCGGKSAVGDKGLQLC